MIKINVMQCHGRSIAGLGSAGAGPGCIQLFFIVGLGAKD